MPIPSDRDSRLIPTPTAPLANGQNARKNVQKTTNYARRDFAKIEKPPGPTLQNR